MLYMVPSQMSTPAVTRALRNAGITNPADRRAFLEGKDLQARVRGILENNPKLQEELANTMGIGDDIIEHLHEVMEQDFQESETLLHGLIEFFQTYGKLDLRVYTIANASIRSLHTGDARERLQDADSLFLSSEKEDFINEKILLQTESEESSQPSEHIGGGFCFKITTSVGAKLLLSFGDKDTPKNKIMNIQQLFKKTGLLKRIKEKIKHIQIKYTDHLTGLYNKHYIESVTKKNTPYSIIFLDLDKFKEYNDTNGHAAGDILLQEIAKILQSSVRHNDKVCRNGGDEFIIFIDTCDTREEIDIIQERIQENIDTFNIRRQIIADSLDNTCSTVSITSGHAIWDTKGTLEDIIRRADKEMFKSKNNKGNEGGIYRIVDKVSKLSPGQQKQIIAGLLAINPGLLDTNREGLCSL